jgi:hypothetical protein
MPRSSRPQPLTTLDQLDRQLREPPRQHAQILDLDAFRRHVDTIDAETDLKHALNLAFADLGGAAFALAHQGALNDNRLAAHVQRIHQLYTQLDALAHTTPVTPPADAAAEHAGTA